MVSKIDKLLKINAQIIQNANLFKISYLPREILERSETETLYKEIAPFTTYKTPNHILIVGDPGTGKTVTANFIAERMPGIEHGVEVMYVNCNNKTPSQIMSVLLHIDLTESRNANNIVRDFFVNRIEKHTLLILDEIDKGYKLYDFLYLLSRPKEHYPALPHEISLILISNNLYWEEQLPPHIRSSLQLVKVPFRSYTKNQLKEILKYRIKYGFTNPSSLSEELLDKLIEKVVEHKHSDCRVALKTVFLAAKNAEIKNRPVIQEKDLDVAYTKTIHEIESQRMSALTHNHFLILLACFSGKQTLEEIHKEYLGTFKQFHIKRWKPLKKTAFFNSLEYLDSQGLITKDVITEKDDKNILIKKLICKTNIDESIVKKEVEKRVVKHEKINEE